MKSKNRKYILLSLILISYLFQIISISFHFHKTDLNNFVSSINDYSSEHSEHNHYSNYNFDNCKLISVLSEISSDFGTNDVDCFSFKSEKYISFEFSEYTNPSLNKTLNKSPPIPFIS